MADKTYFIEQPSSDVSAMLRGGGFGGFSSIGDLIGLIIAAGIFGNGNGFGFGGGGNNNAEREMLMQAINRNGQDVNSLATKFGCSVDQVLAAINGLSGAVCKLAGDQGISSERIINAILSGNNQVMNQLASCCCDLKGIISQGFSDLGYATRDQTCAVKKAIAASTAQVIEGQRAAEMRELNRDIAERDRQIAQRDNVINNYQQTQTFSGMIQQAVSPLYAGIQKLQGDVDGIICKLPKTATVPYSDVVGIPNCVAAQYGLFGFPFGLNVGGNGSFF